MCWYMQKNKNNLLERLKMASDARFWGLLAFGLISVLITWSGIKVVQTNYDLEKKISVAKQKNDIQKLENENLKLKNRYYESSQYLELSARRQFGKSAPGERLYNVPAEVALSKTVEPLNSSQKTNNTIRTEPQSGVQHNFDSWVEFLFR